MVAPSKTFTLIVDTAIDADSPLTEDLMQDLRDNDIHLQEWLGESYVAAKDHNHDGTNSAPVSPTITVPVLQELENENEKSMASITYATQYRAEFYLQSAQSVKLDARYYLKTSLGGGDGVKARLLVDGSTSGAETAAHTAGSYAWVNGGASLTVSLAAGWHSVEVQIQRNNSGGGSETVYIAGGTVAAS